MVSLKVIGSGFSSQQTQGRCTAPECGGSKKGKLGIAKNKRDVLKERQLKSLTVLYISRPHLTFADQNKKWLWPT